jgi:hypothetical protein
MSLHGADRHEAEVAQVVGRLTAELGPQSTWPTPVLLEGLALCVLNAVYSTGNRSESVVRVLDRYRRRRSEAGASPDTDGPAELVAEINSCGGPAGFADALDNHWRAWQHKSAPYKTDVIHGAAQLLVTESVHNRDDLQAALEIPTRHDALKRGWRGLPGQRSGLTWRYFLMNAGMPGIKADRMIMRWTSRALKRPTTPKEAAQILTDAASRLGVDTRRLDHAVWDRERQRQ